MAEKTVTLEDSFHELEEILAKLDSDDISLEDSFSLYTKGMKLVKTCNSKIEKVEKKLQIIGEEEAEK